MAGLESQRSAEAPWSPRPDRGGAGSAAAERDLASVTALFDIADQYVTNTTGATLSGLVAHVHALELPTTGTRPDRADAVAICSPHAALERDWDFVVLAGLQEGLWPNTVPRGGVLGTQHLVDVLDGVTGSGDGPTARVSTRAPLLAEERRLLIAAMGRARSRLLVTAVDSDTGDAAMLPSPFCTELAALATEDPDTGDEREIDPGAAGADAGGAGGSAAGSGVRPRWGGGCRGQGLCGNAIGPPCRGGRAGRGPVAVAGPHRTVDGRAAVVGG